MNDAERDDLAKRTAAALCTIAAELPELRRDVAAMRALLTAAVDKLTRAATSASALNTIGKLFGR